MKSRIHPSAVIHPAASLGADVEIGPFVVIGPKVEIGDRARIMPHAHIVTRTRVGSDCQICSSAVVGGDPQDLKFKGEDTDVIIGSRTRIGEFATINRGTGVGGGVTSIGDDCLIMAYVHVAHDCLIGNQVIITNCTQLAGHIRIEDQAWISSSCQIHHFVTIGSMSFLAPSSGLHFDVPPYVIVEGFRDTCQVRALNLEGLHRRNVAAESIAALKKAFRTIYRQEGKTRAETLAELAQADISRDPCVANLLAHVKASYEGKQNRALEKFRSDRSKPVSGVEN